MFEPKNDKPMWELVFDYVQEKPTNTIISFDELSEVIDGEIRENRSAVYKARKQLAKTQKRFMIAVSGQGYRIVEGKDQLYHAESRHDKANKQIQLANFEAINLNSKLMTADEKSRWQTFLAWNSMALSTMSHNTEQIAKVNTIATNANDVIGEQLNKLQKQMQIYSNQMSVLQNKIK